MTAAAVSVAWAEQLAIWIVWLPIAVACLALIQRWSRRHPDPWPIHDTRDGDQ